MSAQVVYSSYEPMLVNLMLDGLKNYPGSMLLGKMLGT
jgi:hypothetical protein